MFPAYVEDPKSCRFEGQDVDEKILLVVRAHPITNSLWIFQTALLLVLPFIFPSLLAQFGLSLTIIPRNFLTVFTTIDYLLALVVAFEGFLGWYFNVNILTNKRVVDIDFWSMLAKNIYLAPLDKIEEADAGIGGLFGTMLNFGHVSIQTAGAKIAIVMRNIPNPALVADRILDEAEKVK